MKGSAEFTGDEERLEQFVDALQPWGGTSLYDAIHYGLNRVKDQRGRKALIVFSDGDDTTSPHEGAGGRGLRAGGGGHGLHDRHPRRAGRRRGARAASCGRSRSETGGEFFFPERVGELTRCSPSIADELHNHYLLAYAPRGAPTAPSADHAATKRKDAEVRVRKGYFAISASAPAAPGAPRTGP